MTSTHGQVRCSAARARGGFFLPAALLVIAGLAGLISVSVTRSMTELSAVRTSTRSHQAFQVAEAGVDAATLYLRQLPAPPNSRTSFNPFGGPRSIGIGTYNVVVNPSTDNTTTFVDDFNITVTAAANGMAIKRDLTCVLQMESFARFAYFVDKHLTLEDDEDDDARGEMAWWGEGTEVAGPVHINDKLNIKGHPTFHGLVSSTAHAVNYHSGASYDTPEFLGGLELDAKRIALPTSLDTLGSKSRLFEGNTTVELNDGSIFVTNEGTTRIYDVSKPVFVKKGDLILEGGTLQGQLTLASDKNIVIHGSAYYACDPQQEFDPDCQDPSNPAKSSKDLLGLVAKKNIVLDVPEAGDLTIQATLMALKGSLKAAHHKQGSPKGVVRIFGGVIQRREGHLGVVNSAGELVSGYQAAYAYDRRLLGTAPPYFPTTGRYKEVMWIDTVTPVFIATGDDGSGNEGHLWDSGGTFDPSGMNYPGGYSEEPPLGYEAAPPGSAADPGGTADPGGRGGAPGGEGSGI